MIQTAFDLALHFTLQWEGGYSNNPADPGGATMKGVTQRVYDAYRKSKKLPVQDVREISDVEVHELYRTRYWNAVGGDNLKSPLDLVMFDSAVNHGPGWPRRWLSQAMLHMDADPSDDGLELARRVIDLRVSFYYRIVQQKPTMKIFLKGWLNRARALKQKIGY